jgi:hypothetical protein
LLVDLVKRDFRSILGWYHSSSHPSFNAWHGSLGRPASPTGCSPRPNANMRHALAATRRIPGVTRSAAGTPTATGAAASGTTNGRLQSAHSRPMGSAYRTCTATHGSGCRIAHMTTMLGRLRTGPPAQAMTALAVCSVVVPGAAILGTSARPIALGTPPPTFEPATSASVSGGRLVLEPQSTNPV